MIFRFLIFLMLFYLVYNLVRRLFPRPASGMAGGGKYHNGSRHEGEVNIDYDPQQSRQKNSSSNKLGEYVDYEEVEE